MENYMYNIFLYNHDWTIHLSFCWITYYNKFTFDRLRLTGPWPQFLMQKLHFQNVNSFFFVWKRRLFKIKFLRKTDLAIRDRTRIIVSFPALGTTRIITNRIPWTRAHIFNKYKIIKIIITHNDKQRNITKDWIFGVCFYLQMQNVYTGRRNDQKQAFLSICILWHYIPVGGGGWWFSKVRKIK